MVDGGMKCVKYVLFIFNLLFFLSGLSLVILGSMLLTKYKQYFDFFGGTVNIPAIVVIAVGGIIFVIGFFGCCGAYKENHCMMSTYAVLLATLFVLEIGAGIAAFVVRSSVTEFMTAKLKDGVNLQNYDGFVKKFWEEAQSRLHCCGAVSSADWRNSTWRNNTGGGLKAGAVPDSCCLDIKPKCGNTDDTTTIHTKGCIGAFNELINNNGLIVAGVGGGVAVLQVIGIILACCLAKNIRKDYDIY